MYEKVWKTPQECSRKLEQPLTGNNNIQPNFGLSHTQSMLSDKKATLRGTGSQLHQMDHFQMGIL